MYADPGDPYKQKGFEPMAEQFGQRAQSFIRPPSQMGVSTGPVGRPPDFMGGPMGGARDFGPMPMTRPFEMGPPQQSVRGMPPVLAGANPGPDAGVIDRFGRGGPPYDQAAGPSQRFMGRMGRRRILRRGGGLSGGGSGPFMPPPPQTPDLY